jgi:hypothetical protein
MMGNELRDRSLFHFNNDASDGETSPWFPTVRLTAKLGKKDEKRYICELF